MTASQPKKQALPITVVILTLNEQENLPGAIESVREWASEVFVVDSCSTDKTVDVSIEHAVEIVQREFTNYSDQWNWAIDRLPIKTPWILKLDADERLSAELKEEIGSVVVREPDENAFAIPVRLWFMGKRMHPRLRVVRLWRLGKARFSDVIVNEHLLVDGATGYLRSCIEHMDSPNLHRWYEKQNRCTTMEAIMRVRGDALAAQPRVLGSPLERRMWLKKMFYRIPFRYQLQWLYEALVRGAIWDGSVGRAWLHLRIECMRAIEYKVNEMRMTGRIPEIPRAAKGDFDPRVLASPLQGLVMDEGGNAS